MERGEGGVKGGGVEGGKGVEGGVDGQVANRTFILPLWLRGLALHLFQTSP